MLKELLGYLIDLIRKVMSANSRIIASGSKCNLMSLSL